MTVGVAQSNYEMYTTLADNEQVKISNIQKVLTGQSTQSNNGVSGGTIPGLNFDCSGLVGDDFSFGGGDYYAMSGGEYAGMGETELKNLLSEAQTKQKEYSTLAQKAKEDLDKEIDSTFG